MTNRSDVVVIASAEARTGKRQELERALREVAEPTRGQPGCVLFSLYRSGKNPLMIIAHERWASREDHQRHLQSARVQKLMSAMADSLAEPLQSPLMKSWMRIRDTSTIPTMKVV